MLAGWEIVLLFAVMLLVFNATQFLGWGPGSRQERNGDQKHQETFRGYASFVLWLAHGFGVGRIPWAPGTFGSVVGLLWFAVLLSTQNIWGFLGGIFGGVIASVWICGQAETILKQRDPGSIVLDEICAVPICFVPWIVSELSRQDGWPPLETFFGAKAWYLTVIIFVLFRIFDILKPPPVRQSQRLPGGWGVVTDDVLAALYVCALSLIVFH